MPIAGTTCVSCHAGVGDFGVSDAIGGLLNVAKLSLEVYKTITSTQLQQEALKIKRQGIEAERQVALETLAFYKSQEEAARGATSSGGISDFVAPAAIGIAAVLVLVLVFSRRR